MLAAGVWGGGGCAAFVSQVFISAFPVLPRQEKVKTFSSFVMVKNKNIMR